MTLKRRLTAGLPAIGVTALAAMAFAGTPAGAAPSDSAINAVRPAGSRRARPATRAPTDTATARSARAPRPIPETAAASRATAARPRPRVQHHADRRLQHGSPGRSQPDHLAAGRNVNTVPPRGVSPDHGRPERRRLGRHAGAHRRTGDHDDHHGRCPARRWRGRALVHPPASRRLI